MQATVKSVHDKALVIEVASGGVKKAPNEDDSTNVLYMPMLLVVPPDPDKSMAPRIREHWPRFKAIISSSDHAYKDTILLSIFICYRTASCY
jgi:hypothetical protein